MSYVGWAIVAMLGNGATTFFLKVALRSIPPEVALVITNSMLVLAGIILVIIRGENISSHLNMAWPTLFIVLAWLTLSLRISGFYTGLSRSPASVVFPIFAISFSVASLLSILFLDEGSKLTRLEGIVMAAGAIVLLTR